MDHDTYTPSLPDLPAGRIAARKIGLLAVLEDDHAMARHKHKRPAFSLPRAKPWRLRLALGGTGLVAAAVATIFMIDSGTSPAYASWTPAPSAAPDSASIASLAAACRERLASSPALAGLPAPDRTVAVERRGDITAIVLDSPLNPASHGACIQTPTGDLIGGPGEKPRRWPSSQIQLINGPSFFDQQNGATSFFGRVSPATAKVTITTFSGLHLDATVSNGWFFAWWPTTPNNQDYTSAKTVTAIAADGTNLETVDAQGGVPDGPALKSQPS